MHTFELIVLHMIFGKKISRNVCITYLRKMLSFIMLSARQIFCIQIQGNQEKK